jgi:hypothetical protein
VIRVELTPDVLNEPRQCAVRAIDQGDDPLLGSLAARALPVPHVELAESAQLPPDVVKVEHARFVDSQPDVSGQPGHRVVPRRRGELAARSQLVAPTGEQLLQLGLRGRNPHLGID